MNAVDYCRNKAAPPGSNFYYSSLFYSPAVQRQLYCLHAFLTEVQDVMLECTDPGVARIKIAWWGEEITRARSNAARHPVGQELSKIIRNGLLEPNRLQAFLEMTGKQLSNNSFSSYDNIQAFTAGGSGLIWEDMARLCNPQQGSSIAFANKAGCLFRYFDNLQSARALIKNQQFMTAKTDLARFNIEADDLLKPGDEKTSGYFALQIDRLIEDLQENCESIARTDRRTLLLFIILSQIIIKTCEEIRHEGYRLTEKRISLTPLRKLWISWCTRISN